MKRDEISSKHVPRYKRGKIATPSRWIVDAARCTVSTLTAPAASNVGSTTIDDDTWRIPYRIERIV